MAARNRITVDSLIEELDAAKAQATELKQPSVAVSAVMSKARLVGLLVDRKESGTPGEFAGLQSEAETIAKVRAELGDDAAGALAKALAQADSAVHTQPEAEVDPLPIEPTNTGNSTLN